MPLSKIPAAYIVRCDQCGAEVDEPCRTPAGKSNTSTHRVRVAAAEEERARWDSISGDGSEAGEPATLERAYDPDEVNLGPDEPVIDLEEVKLIEGDPRRPVAGYLNYGPSVTEIDPRRPMGPNLFGEILWPVTIQRFPNVTRVGFSYTMPGDVDLAEEMTHHV